MAEVGDHALDRVRVVREDRPDAAVEAGRADARPERDAAVAGGAGVADREPRVGDRLAAGPAQLRQPVGDRLGQDDVAAPRQDPRPKARPAGGPGVGGQDHPLSASTLPRAVVSRTR